MKERPKINGHEIVGRMPVFQRFLRDAIRSRRKRVTRRVIKPPFEIHTNGSITRRKGNERLHPYKCPYGQAGDVRVLIEPLKRGDDGLAYYDDDNAPVISNFTGEPLKWRWSKSILTSIHMPYEAGRVLTRYGSIQYGRLQDITDKDALGEGVIETKDFFRICSGKGVLKSDGATARDAFRHLWDMINGKKYPWVDNDWVWIIPFEQI